MKFNFILLMMIFLASCNGSSQQTGQQNDIEINWQVSQVTTQDHSYTESGMLDTTRQIQDIYVNGMSGVVMTFLIRREYDNRSNLTSERTYQVFEKKNQLSSEVVYKYDTKNNLILVTDKFENVISKIITNTYNDKNQKTEEIRIQKGFDENPEDWNLDSAVAHHNDKKIPHYDTSIISYQYDTKGNLINQFHKNHRREITSTLTTLFTDSQKDLTFGINSNGDTVSITTYQKNGNLLTEIKHDKNNLLYIDTSIYDGNKLIQIVSIDKRMNSKNKETYKYDLNGNEVEHISYK